ncbi:MAG: formate dehydrogenase subunit alpha [Candidatus Eutrophobiaceae bacterium]
MVAKEKDLSLKESIRFSVDGKELVAWSDETILQATQRHSISIPYLCYKEGYRSDGNCRACVVEIKGERALAPSCCRKPAEGMKVYATSERARHSQGMVLELLKSDMPIPDATSPYTHESELDHWHKQMNLPAPRFPMRKQDKADPSHPAIAVNLDACIQCTRCVRACREEQVNDVIGMASRGRHAKIVFDNDLPMGESSCVACGECVQACPTGALMPANGVGLETHEKLVKSVCPYCGVGCLLNFKVQKNRILSVDGRDGLTNHSRLCVKGRYGFDYVHHPDRLKTPLIRRENSPKTPALLSQANIEEHFREATWEEALDKAAAGFKRIRDTQGKRALAGFGCAKGSNEEAYLFQKLVRTGFGSNNVDHCTRMCHASSVAAMLETIGSAAVSNQVEDGTDAEVIIVIGARPDINHPVAATFIKNAAQRGSKLIVIEPYGSELARHATHFLQLRPSTDISLLNAIMHVIITEDLHNKDFIAEHTNGFDALKETVLQYPPEKVAGLCAIPAEQIREVARQYATARSAIIFWGMGISQHTHGTQNALCLISLALITGQIGRPSTGLHPLRGQNNVQGASDVGLIPMVYPDYQSVSDPAARRHFEKLWNTELDPIPGKTVVEIIHAIHDGELNGLYIMGENPAMSDPNLNHAREALSMLDTLVVQDIFFTETCHYADIILPASAFPEKTGTFTNTDRRVQLGRKAIDPPGQARQDLWIIQELARRIGLNWNYSTPSEVFAEITEAMPSIAGMTWERLEREDSLTYPLTDKGAPGEPVIFKNGCFPTPDQRGRLIPANAIEPAELPNAEYPWIFMTGRQLEHWHTGTMTRHATTLNTLEPEPRITINPKDLQKLGVDADGLVTVQSRRGCITLHVLPDDHIQIGVVMMPFAYNEAAANLLTNDALDPKGKIPEFKFCAVKITPATPSAPKLS